MENMETIPLRPVFQNPKFKALNPDIKFFVLNAVYKLCTEGKEGEPIPKSLRWYLECSETCYRNNKQVFRGVLESVMPQIVKIKNAKRAQTINAHQANRDKSKKHKDNHGYGELVEPSVENLAPILPQRSRDSEILSRTRILNENQYKTQSWMSAPTKPQSKPMLKEIPQP